MALWFAEGKLTPVPQRSAPREYALTHTCQSLDPRRATCRDQCIMSLGYNAPSEPCAVRHATRDFNNRYRDTTPKTLNRLVPSPFSLLPYPFSLLPSPFNRY